MVLINLTVIGDGFGSRSIADSICAHFVPSLDVYSLLPKAVWI